MHPNEAELMTTASTTVDTAQDIEEGLQVGVMGLPDKWVEGLPLEQKLILLEVSSGVVLCFCCLLAVGGGYHALDLNDRSRANRYRCSCVALTSLPSCSVGILSTTADDCAKRRCRLHRTACHNSRAAAPS
jgi:hypothetical protein